MLPLFAASINLVMTGASGLSAVVKHPGAMAGFMAFMVLPFFAIGGIESANLQAVLDTGATQVAVVRAITEAADPAQAARDLLEMLQ